MNAPGSAVIMWRTTVRPSAWSALMASPSSTTWVEVPRPASRRTRLKTSSTSDVSKIGPQTPPGQQAASAARSTADDFRSGVGSRMDDIRGKRFGDGALDGRNVELPPGETARTVDDDDRRDGLAGRDLGLDVRVPGHIRAEHLRVLEGAGGPEPRGQP